MEPLDEYQLHLFFVSMTQVYGIFSNRVLQSGNKDQ